MEQAWDLQWEMYDRLGADARKYKDRLWIVGLLDILDRIDFNVGEDRNSFREHGYVASVCSFDSFINHIHVYSRKYLECELELSDKYTFLLQ